MYTRIISLSLVTVLTIGSLGGCSAKDCNPSNPKGGALLGGLGCALTGGYAKRRSIMEKRVKISEENLEIAKNRYYKTLLEYQKFMAKVTEDDSKLKRIEKGIKEVDKEAREIAVLYDEIVEEESLYFKIKEKKINVKKRTQLKNRLTVKNQKMNKKLKNYSKNKNKLTKEIVLNSVQKNVAHNLKQTLEKKKVYGSISKNENMQLSKVKTMLNNFEKNNDNAIEDSRRSILTVNSVLARPRDAKMKDYESRIKSTLGITTKSMRHNPLDNTSKQM